MVSTLVRYGSWLFSQPSMTDDATMSDALCVPHHFLLQWLLDGLLYLAKKEAYTLLCHKLFFIL